MKGKSVGAGAEAKPELPKILYPYWRAFLDLHQRRVWSQAGPQPIGYREYEAYIRLKFIHKGANQIKRLIRFAEELDNAYLADYSEKQKRS